MRIITDFYKGIFSMLIAVYAKLISDLSYFFHSIMSFSKICFNYIEETKKDGILINNSSINGGQHADIL